MALKIRPSWWAMIAAQGVLLVVEVVWPYDGVARRIALVITNVVGTAGLLWYFHKNSQAVLTATSTWVLVAGAIWLDALGNFFGLYGQYWWWNHLTHMIGTAAVAVITSWLWAAHIPPVSVGIVAWLGLLTSQAIAAWYEISEYLGDLFFDTRRVGPGFDTSKDLWFNFLGGGLGVLIWLVQHRVAAGRRKMV